MKDLTQVKKWQLQDGSVLDTREVFAKIFANQISSSTMCRSEANDWQPLNSVFSVVGYYGIIRELGEGAFGKVYLAFDSRRTKDGKMGRLVAIKRPTKSVLDQYARQAGKQGTQGEMFSRMAIGQVFSQESLLTARLAMCPYVVKVLDHDVSIPYVVLEFCNEGSLSDRILKPYTEQDVYKWAYEISSALLAAHSLTPDSMIHRDLKPQNILLNDGAIKVSDFGASKMAYESESLRSLSGGYTPKYAAPEALDGKAYPGTDIWSFGVILYNLTSGVFPFNADSMVQLMKQITCNTVTPLAQKRKLNIDDNICNFIDQCLQKDPTLRPKTQECVDFFANYLPLKTMDAKSRNTHMQKASKVPLEKNKIRTLEQTRKKNAHKTLKRQEKHSKTPKKNFSPIIFTILLAIVFAITYPMLTKAPYEEQSKNNQIKKKEAKKPKKIEGFTYTGQNTYSAGGQTHTVQEYRHNKTEIEFVLIPAGSFIMGSNTGEPDEMPKHKVTLNSFLMSKYEVTNEKYMDFVRNTNTHHPEWIRPGSKYNINNCKDAHYKRLGKPLNNENNPVTGVSWESAKAYCQWAGLDLPTEAQWEYACRAGTTTKHYWEKALKEEYCWYRGNSGKAHHQVGTKKPNAFGLFDMMGNVWEWCNDWYDSKYYQSSSIVDPIGPLNGNRHVFRGGGWCDSYFTSSDRGIVQKTDYKSCYLGFRVCKSLLFVPKRFKMLPGGIVWDRKTNCEWYLSPGDMNFNGTKTFLKGLQGNGWKLPTRKDFLNLLEKSQNGKRKLNPIFNTSERLPWIERNGQPFFMDMQRGTIRKSDIGVNRQTFAVRIKNH